MRKIRLISGPCSAETQEQVLATARDLISLRDDLSACGYELEAFRAGVWKPRTRPGNFEGKGEAALPWLAQEQELFGLPAMAEVATPEHVEKAVAAGIKLLWIGARTTTNPFDTQAIADALRGTDVKVFVKNPMNPDVDLWLGAVERVQRAGICDVVAIHRGFSFYEKSRYRNFPKWQVPIEFKRRMPEVPLLCDSSHIAGKREYIAEISQKALDLGFDGLFIESHCNPEVALSDSQQQLKPIDLLEMLRGLSIRESDLKDTALDARISGIRANIDIVDDNMLDLIHQRMKLVDEIAVVKRENNMTVLQRARWEDILKKVTQGAVERDLDSDFIAELFRLVHQASIDRQS